MVPPLPEKYPIAPDNEVVDSESELPLVQSPTHDAPEASEGWTRKRARSPSESSDASTPPTPRDPPRLARHSGGDGGSASPIPVVPVRSVAPQSLAKRKKEEKKEEKKGRRGPPVFALSDLDS